MDSKFAKLDELERHAAERKAAKASVASSA
jgi:hypothetical protein